MPGQHATQTAMDESVPVKLALEQSQEVKAKVEECAEDISVANAVVQTRIAEGAMTVSAHEALAEGKEVEAKIQDCANDLQEVTETLSKGVDDLKQLQVDLSESRSALAESKAALASSKEAEKEARHLALHDSTTGLPNRALFDTRLDQAISLAKRQGWTLAVMFLDLDRFKVINDVHGHSAGDAVLKEVAERLSGHAREEDTVCRNGGDEFLYLLVNPQGDENVERIAQAVAERISLPIAVDGLQLMVQASIGIAVYPRNAQSGESLIRQADAAMYDAKKTRSSPAFVETVEKQRAA